VTGLRLARQRTMAAVARRLASGAEEDWFTALGTTMRPGEVLIAGDHGPVNGWAPRAAAAAVLRERPDRRRR